MARLVAPCVYLLALNGCSLLMTLHPLVSEENAVAEPRLVGTWEIIDPGMNDDEDTTRFLVTTISPGNDSGRGAAYQVAFATVDGDTVVYVGRLGPFDGDRWVLDLTPGGPVPALTTRYPNLLSAHVPVIVRRDSAELGFAFFNESVDDLVSAVREGVVRTEYLLLPSSDYGDDNILLTERYPDRLLDALRDYAKRPNALVALPFEGHRIERRRRTRGKIR